MRGVVMMKGLVLTEEDEPLLEKLSQPYRDILRAANTHNSKCQEMADALGMNVGTVKSRLNRAKKALFALRPKKKVPAV